MNERRANARKKERITYFPPRPPPFSSPPQTRSSPKDPQIPPDATPTPSRSPAVSTPTHTYHQHPKLLHVEGKGEEDARDRASSPSHTTPTPGAQTRTSRPFSTPRTLSERIARCPHHRCSSGSILTRRTCRDVSRRKVK